MLCSSLGYLALPFLLGALIGPGIWMVVLLKRLLAPFSMVIWLATYWISGYCSVMYSHAIQDALMPGFDLRPHEAGFYLRLTIDKATFLIVQSAVSCVPPALTIGWMLRRSPLSLAIWWSIATSVPTFLSWVIIDQQVFRELPFPQYWQAITNRDPANMPWLQLGFRSASDFCRGLFEGILSGFAIIRLRRA